MKAAVFRAPGDVRIESVPEPAAPGPGELLIKVSKAALCGTDSAEWDHGPLLARPPVILGHEFTGQVVAVGGPGSHLLAALSQANCLFVVPEEATELRAGAEVEVIPLADLAG